MSRRLFTTLGLVGAGGAAYYFYQAGGDPKSAQKKFEADASHLQSKVQNKEGEAERQAGLSGQALGAKADSAVERAKAEGKEISSELNRYSKDAERRLESGRKEAKSGVIGAVDNIDQNVEKGAGKVTQSVSDGADKAKSSISSWFGGSN